MKFNIYVALKGPYIQTEVGKFTVSYSKQLLQFPQEGNSLQDRASSGEISSVAYNWLNVFQRKKRFQQKL